MKVHRLQTDEEPWQAVAYGNKRFEYRRNDRDFQQGDLLILEYTDDNCESKHLLRRVGYVLRGPDYGVPEGYCVMSIRTADDDGMVF